MSFPEVNAHVISTLMTAIELGAAGSAHPMLPTGIQYPLFNTPGVVDVSGMEFAVAMQAEASTGLTQDLASGASTVEFQFGDAGTTATQTASANHLINSDDLSNTRTGGYTVHEAVTSVGTSTTDLDADDWVNLHVVANATGDAGVGAIQVKAAYVYGKPGAIA